jgi:hypothetical protein
MTGYTVHTGSTLKFSSGWDRIFGNAKGAAPRKKTAAKKKGSTAGKKKRRT